MCQELIRTVCEVLGTVFALGLVIVTGVLAYWTLGLVNATQGLVTATQDLLKETRDASTKQLQVNTWLQFIARWDSGEMHTKRKLIAAAVKQYQIMDGTDPVLDFFEQVGILYEKACIDKDLVYSSFSHDAENWWYHLKDHVYKLRDKMRDKGVYDKYEKMVETIHKEHPDDPAITKEDGQEYLQSEMEL